MSGEVLSTIIASATTMIVTIVTVWSTNRRDIKAQTRQIEEITQRQTEQLNERPGGGRP